MTEAYNFERDLLETCGAKRMSRVVKALSSGQVDAVPGGVPVNYLIFEEAKGDVRGYLDEADAFDIAWVLRVLHHIATGLNQLHSAGIAHQDMKPSNALIFEDGASKVADLGCADQAGSQSPRGEQRVPGDRTYAPPELLYGHVPSDWKQRRQACDLYHLGSLALFLFTGVTTTYRGRHTCEWLVSVECPNVARFEP